MATLAAMSVLAHQGGWDEILFVLAPLLVFGGLLWLARRRADEMDRDDAGPLEAPEGQESADPR